MDTRTGRIYTEDEIKEMYGEDIPYYIRPMKLPATKIQTIRKPPKVGRNEPCPCGSGKKFKKCCLMDEPQYPKVRK